MKGLKIAYWVSTGLLSAMMLMSVYMYFTSPDIAVGFKKLGFPDYFRIELGIAKFLGVVALLAPVPPRVKEWAYFGFFINFISAGIAHFHIGESVMSVVIALVLLVVSYVTYHQTHKTTVVTA